MTFREKTKEQRESPRPTFSEIDTKYKDLVRSWGEDPDQTPMADFIGVFVRLIDELKKCHEANEAKKQAEAKEAKKAAAAALAEERKHSVRSGAPTIATGALQRGVLDELMGKLHAGGGLRKIPPKV
jgi:hypothetical protein